MSMGKWAAFLPVGKDFTIRAYPDDVGAGLVPALPVGIADTGRAQNPPLRPVMLKLVDFGCPVHGMHQPWTQAGVPVPPTN